MSEITKCPHCGIESKFTDSFIGDNPIYEGRCGTEFWKKDGVPMGDYLLFERTPACYERQLAQKEAEFAEFAALYTDLENHFVWAKDKLEQKEAEIARLHKMLMGDNEGALLLSDLTETAKTQQDKIAALESALRGVIRVADRDTVEFNAAKDALK